MKKDSSLHIATIGGAHGIKGEVRVKSLAEEPMALADYKPLRDGEGRSFRIKRLRPSKSVLVVKFEGINSREDAEALNGRELYIARNDLPELEDDEEVYAVDLIGLEVRDATGDKIGIIRSVPDFGAGDLLEIDPAPGHGTGSFFIPFTLELIPELHVEEGYVVAVLPDEVSERD